MSLNRITSITDLLTYLPLFSKLYDELDGIWEPDLTKEDFLERVTEVFFEQSYFFLEPDGHGFKYLIVMQKERHNGCHFWIFYMNKNFRSETKSILLELKSFCRDLGIKQVRFTTNRLTRSYERWVSKFGARKQSLTYEVVI